MKKINLYIFYLLWGLPALFSQTAFMTDEGVAVFYPERFDSIKSMPSLAIIKDLPVKEDLPESWELVPEFSSTDSTSLATMEFSNNIDFYGNGEVTGNLRRNGTETTLWNTDNYEYKKHDGKQLYQSHPWLLGVRPNGSAFGILADNTWKQHFQVNKNIEITSEGPPFRMIIIEKDSPQEVMKSLGDLIGTIPMPPLWALGYQQSRFSYFPADSVRYVAKEFRKRNIPADVMWMDIDYMDEYRVFTFDTIGFPDPRKLNADLHQMDFKSIYMIDPGVKVDSSYNIYQQGVRGNHWVLNESGEPFIGEVWPGDCSFPDYTRPETQQWWSKLYLDFMDMGIDGVWNDMNEPAVFDQPGFTIPEENWHRGGGNLPPGIHRRYHNIYGMLMVKSSREGILQANPNKRPFVLSRANFLGGQRYAATWTGDNHSSWEYLKMSIPMSLNLSLSGQPFNGPDIGGFTKDASADLFGHWISIGAYFPFCRNHSSKNTRAQEPWAFGEEIEEVSREAINRRYQLLPYLYTLFYEAHKSGMPIMRPVFFADIEDPRLREEQETFLLGKNLLIIPQWAKKPKLPKGGWKQLTFPSAIDEYQAQVKIRPGAIVPWLPSPIQSTDDYSSSKLVLLVNPDSLGHASGQLYNDDGDGFDFETGAFSLKKFRASIQDGNLQVSIDQVGGDWNRNQEYQIGYVKNGQIQYSQWFNDNQEISMELNSNNKGKHLFILSGQSNMARLQPETSFIPFVEATYGKDNVIIVKDAVGGQPIRRWYKKWKSPDVKSSKPTGDLYEKLVKEVEIAIRGSNVASISFIWMQGERDAKEEFADIYQESLQGLYAQLRKDFKRNDINFIIGRLNDFDMENKQWPDWTRIRDIQVKVGESNPRFSWVDTDDLNTGYNLEGKAVEDDLHLSKNGYRELGRRFAQEAIELISRFDK